MIFIVGRLVESRHSSDWASKFVGLGWLGFSIGVVAALPDLDTPESIGPAIAFSFLSLLYVNIALVMGLIWAPHAIASQDGTLELGLGFATPMIMVVLAVLYGLTLILR